MNINRISLVSCMIGAFFLTGCEKASEPPTPATSTSESAAPAQSSVAAPPSAVPPSDAAMKPPAQEASSSGDAGVPSQIAPGTLTKAEEQKSMPQSGQVNNHSVPNTTAQQK